MEQAQLRLGTPCLPLLQLWRGQQEVSWHWQDSTARLEPSPWVSPGEKQPRVWLGMSSRKGLLPASAVKQDQPSTSSAKPTEHQNMQRGKIPGILKAC